LNPVRDTRRQLRCYNSARLMLRRRVRPLLLLVLCVAPLATAASKSSLEGRIDQILSQPDVARGFWGIEIVSLPKGKVLYARNEHKLFTPASNTKLFTTATALALIGPDYRFRTTVETTGTLDKYGRLTGDLVLVGRGDPNLSGRVLPYNLHTERDSQPIKVLSDLADDLVRKGLKFVDGDVVADDSYYAFERYGEGWSQDDLVWGDGAPVSALTINDNVVFVNILPADHIGDRAFVSVSPFADYYHIDNRIITTPPGTGPRKIYINREPGSRTLTLWGNMPVDDAGANEALAIEDPADYAADLFRQLLEQRGVVIYGGTRSHHTELASLSTVTVTSLASHGGGTSGATSLQDQSVALASYQSQPLADDLTVINKVSQNLHAELLLRLLGREKGNAGTIEAGEEVVRTFLTQQVGINPDEFVFYDGSGLSRENLVTPHAIVQLLQYASSQPWALLYQGTLPVAGVDGSLADRFKGTPGLGHIQGKTGSLNHVNALSGYATTLKGEKVTFSILTNNHHLSDRDALNTIDQIMLAVMQQ
jgi:serine-type D-Ala-D-Ala carboxypeptidase/endopeptidase (penicillin-binding protein 4)